MVKDGIWDRHVSDLDVEQSGDRPDEIDVRTALKTQRESEGEEFVDCLIGAEVEALEDMAKADGHEGGRGGRGRGKASGTCTGSIFLHRAPAPRGTSNTKLLDRVYIGGCWGHSPVY